jgi:hypothetical protein
MGMAADDFFTPVGSKVVDFLFVVCFLFLRAELFISYMLMLFPHCHENIAQATHTLLLRELHTCWCVFLKNKVRVKKFCQQRREKEPCYRREKEAK